MLRAELREQGRLKIPGGDRKSEAFKQKSTLSTMDKVDSAPKTDEEQNLTLFTMDKVTHPEPDTESELVMDAWQMSKLLSADPLSVAGMMPRFQAENRRFFTHTGLVNRCRYA